MRVGIAHHLGWAVAVLAASDHRVVARHRVELVEPGLPSMPVHHRAGRELEDDELAALVDRVRASATRLASAALDELAAEAGEPIASLSLRAWPRDFPTDIAVQRRVPHESRADSVMYRQVLAEQASDRGWPVHRYDAKTVEAEAADLLGDRADAVLRGPRATLGPPWNADHRVALAATVVASAA